ncbi:hypothetical protein [Burkholderia oklahomensis]|uniref:Uncharacterized protein n=1 Tax=Burkholderia oklahomensis TaxID=342113 RepID=A0AAI8BEK7_9BURK|nr:hypothetical protein [Burkholderia oklahomensis]AIO70882.1 hypothetical protein DM82_5671 [Burkholderia oklahomensis]AJX35234.1 hypothetical protein BG90_4963 [Burkholderia oklahomensis C6786]SUY27263.1 Uncharacterised protein [Burkholderia oklahomensis]
MNDLKKKDRDTHQQHRKYAQDNATDDGMPVAPEKPRHAIPTECKPSRTSKQQISDARERSGME